MANKTQASIYGEIPSRWNITTLKNVCIQPGGVQTGPFGSQLHQRDYQPFGTPIITVEHLGENRIIHQSLPYVSNADCERLSRYTLRSGDIVFSRVGSVDRRSLVRKAENGWLFSGRCLRVRPNSNHIDSDYLSWFFGLPSFKEHIRRIAVGATMPSLNTDLLSNVEVILPPLEEQKAIAHILGTLDDKIELNQQMNRNLEAIAQTIFKSWFVDFNPVRAKVEGKQPAGMNALAAALFPDSFEDSRLGEIPKGWGVKTLGEVVELAYGKALREDNRRPGDIPVFGSNGQIGWHDEKLVDSSGIVVGRKGNPGTVIWCHTAFFPIDTTFYVVPKDSIQSRYYLLYALRSQDLPSLSADSAVPGLNRNLAYMNHILVPSSKCLSLFDSYIQRVYEKIQANNEQSRTLTTIRDTLLPKLMSGEIRVKEAEEILEDVA